MFRSPTESQWVLLLTTATSGDDDFRFQHTVLPCPTTRRHRLPTGHSLAAGSPWYCVASVWVCVSSPGVNMEMLARRALWEVGLNYGHGTGHGVGNYFGVHECMFVCFFIFKINAIKLMDLVK